MKKLRNILRGLSYNQTGAGIDADVSNICFDSRRVAKNDLFVAVRGTLTDGHRYIDKAIALGASAIICEDLPKDRDPQVCYIQVKDASKALAEVAANYYDHPSAKLTLVGVTGTNGKTSIATLLYHVFRMSGNKCGLLSTIRILIDEQEIPSTHTTPDPLRINELLAEMVQAGCSYCFMEVSSHSIVQNRVAGLQFKGGIFTNITHDHLDYHHTFSAYIQAKKQFFDQLDSKSFALINADDVNGGVMVQNTHAKVSYYSLKSLSAFTGKILEHDFNGMHLVFNETDFYTPKTGTFNAYNLLAVFGAASILGLETIAILELLSRHIEVEGRFELIKGENDVFSIVDYAHTPDALENVLKTIADINQGKHNIFTVFGCGGDRDKAKRPKMASIAAQYSNQIIITSDNPRTEDPYQILNDIEAGLNNAQKDKALTIENREQAIKTACRMAKSGDIILVAGKGHEKYQDINGVKHHFDDKEVVYKYLNIHKK